jgi:hypothetical protein
MISGMPGFYSISGRTPLPVSSPMKVPKEWYLMNARSLPVEEKLPPLMRMKSLPRNEFAMGVRGRVSASYLAPLPFAKYGTGARP